MPALAHIGDNLIAVCDDGWHVVPEDTTYDDIRKVWVDPVFGLHLPMRKLVDIRTFSVKSARNENRYTVTYDHGLFHCECDGYMYRKRCSHIEKVKTRFKL